MATAGRMEESLSDVDYLVMRARKYSKTDPYACKAWLVTARSLYPKSFLIQFESYQVEKASRNVNEAAKHLEEMFSSFRNEPQLREEVRVMLEALQTDSSEHRHTLLTDIFARIPTTVQRDMLLTVAEKISNPLERCRLLLLAMRNFSSLVHEQGLRLIEDLRSEEAKARMPPVNCYRKLFVCDVLPLLLQSVGGQQLKVTPPQLYYWLQLAVEFYVSYITQPNSGEGPGGGTELSQNKALPNRLPPVAGLLDRENQVIDPWGSLFRLLLLVGQRLGWEFEPNIFNKSRDAQWHYLISLYNRAKQTQSDSGLKQVVYLALLMFMQCFYFYVSHIDTDMSAGGVSGAHAPIVLLEGFPENGDHSDVLHHRAKKHKSEASNQTHIELSSSIPNSEALLSNFTMALKCYELLNSREDLCRDFMTLYATWKQETWAWITRLQIDVSLYQGNFQEAVRQIQGSIKNANTSGKMKMRCDLQMASCFYCLRNYSKACELVLDVVHSIPESQMPEYDQAEKVQSTTGGSGRHLVMMQCTEREVLPYCVQLLVACLKEKMRGGECTDTVLAHLIILLQYDWPRQETLLLTILRHIQERGSFTYNMFFSYIFLVDILEEFAFLDTAEGGGVSLDILPVSTKQLAQQRTVTRGVNKGVKEDFKAALEKQVAKVHEPCPRIISAFLRDEKDAFLQNI